MFLLCLSASSLPAAPKEGEASDTKQPRFSRHIVPLLGRLSCNAGTCHGAVQGQNGFRLSLFGANPAQDQQTLVMEFNGRRLNHHDPDSSLLLQKSTGKVAHQGGSRMGATGPEYKLIRDWIVQGAKLDNVDDSRVKKLKVTPNRFTARKGEPYRLRIEAEFADGSKEDVTHLCTFEALDKDIVSVDFNGQVTAIEAGDTAMVIRYGAEPVVAHVIVPRIGKEPFPNVKGYNFVDDHILTKLRLLNLPPTDVCDDATFLRRVCLDVTGALPTPDEVRAFLTETKEDKRARKVDELLKRPGYSALWATKFSDLLKATGFNGNYAFVEAAENRRFYEWMRARLRDNVPYDQLVERILTATSREGRTQEQWLAEVMTFASENARQTPDLPAYARRQTLDLYWQRENATGIKGAMQVAHAFLGLRMECAQCHRHPHDVWQQDDLLSFANFFTRVKGANYPDSKLLPADAAAMLKNGPNEGKKLSDEAKKLSDKAKDKGLPPEQVEKLRQEALALQMKAGAMTNGPKRFGTEVHNQSGKSNFASVTSPLGTQKSEKFRLLGSSENVTVAAEQDPRVLVMEWMRRADNPYFARAMVNRVWAHYFGRGIVDPPDHLSPLNPASHPELLAALSEGFIKNKYDLHWLHRTILLSRTYQQKYQPAPGSKADKRNYAYFYPRRMPAEVLVDAVNHVTGGKETYPPKLYIPADAKAVEVAGITRSENETATVAFAFQIFGRPLRNAQVQCDCERDNATSIVQMLFLANHPRVREKIEDPRGRVALLAQEKLTDTQKIESLYLWSVSRLPDKDELQTCLDYLKESPSAEKGLQDVLWSLLNTREFILNH